MPPCNFVCFCLFFVCTLIGWTCRKQCKNIVMNVHPFADTVQLFWLQIWHNKSAFRHQIFSRDLKNKTNEQTNNTPESSMLPTDKQTALEESWRSRVRANQNIRYCCIKHTDQPKHRWHLHQSQGPTEASETAASITRTNENIGDCCTNHTD